MHNLLYLQDIKNYPLYVSREIKNKTNASSQDTENDFPFRRSEEENRLTPAAVP